MPSKTKIMIVAGEASADMHAAALVSCLKELRPGIEVYGVGGNRLMEAGAGIIHDFSKAGVVGIGEVFPRLAEFLRVHKRLVQSVGIEKPDAIILLDLPDFNLYLAKKIKALYPGQPILYYISPQIWAWRQRRVRLIKKRIDKMLVIFPFEYDFYAREGVPVEFVGHPLSDRVKPSAGCDEPRKKFGIESSAKVIALLPGSRREENSLYLPAMSRAAAMLLEKYPDIVFIAAVAQTVSEEIIRAGFKDIEHRTRFIKGETYDALAASNAAVVASGTATLETALLGVPMVILAKTSLLNYIIAKPLLKVKSIGLPNIIAGKEIVPELFMSRVNPENIFLHISRLLEDPEEYNRVKKDLEEVRKSVTVENASLKAARAVLEFIDGNKE